MDRKFLIAHHDEKVREKILEGIMKVDGPMAQTIVAVDGAEAAFKIGNDVHHVAFVAADLPKRSGPQLAEWIFSEKSLEPLSVILLQPFPDDDYLIEHVVSGRLQFLTDPQDFQALEKCLMRALDYFFHGDKEEFHLRFFAPGDVLMKEGERGDKCYLLMKGRLRTVRVVDSAEVFLGHVEKGEFVGEMAYINGEPRSADVIVEEATEAIEIPYDRLDHVLFRKPVWARALMRTLSRRLKLANEATRSAE
jgi:CRP/FNR family cyclic AMP-dependent transcriptional regulator